MLNKAKYFAAVIIAFLYLGLFYEIDYYLLKSAFYVARNRFF